MSLLAEGIFSGSIQWGTISMAYPLPSRMPYQTYNYSPTWECGYCGTVQSKEGCICQYCGAPRRKS